jgi:molecular chaperone GrpE
VAETNQKCNKPLFRKLRARLRELTSQVDFNKNLANDNFDKYLRALADLDNYRKRMAKDYLEKEGDANRNLVAKLLPVLDNLDRALLVAGSGKGEEDPFRQGVQMIDQQLRAILEAEGLKHFSSRGEGFDPTRHEAILSIETDKHEPDTVLDEVERGFVFNGKILRPARVTVSKWPQPKESGGQQEEKEQAKSEDQGDSETWD